MSGIKYHNIFNWRELIERRREIIDIKIWDNLVLRPHSGNNDVGFKKQSQSLESVERVSCNSKLNENKRQPGFVLPT